MTKKAAARKAKKAGKSKKGGGKGPSLKERISGLFPVFKKEKGVLPKITGYDLNEIHDGFENSVETYLTNGAIKKVGEIESVVILSYPVILGSTPFSFLNTGMRPEILSFKLGPLPPPFFDFSAFLAFLAAAFFAFLAFLAFRVL
ncbi:hypothetical protein E4U13_002145 [Claviceps humidiphila]|uniref:Uncharacterized protein n=1 Tax=Claviceps humidiphila TaxID=1294629 RepID=A0A9P7TUN8_9HYPO|nr:hypothetical protein E4U13_002145 [Claviceps humidiphila]